jgi:hypothetical protein
MVFITNPFWALRIFMFVYAHSSWRNRLWGELRTW